MVNGMARMNRSAFLKDSWRAAVGDWKRFASIAMITMLGVAVLVGIYAGCRDAFVSAGRFYNQQGLYDIQVTSATGLSDTDIESLRATQGVETVQPEHSTMAATVVDGAEKSATLMLNGTQGLNRPYLQQGRLPEVKGEAAVTQRFMLDSGARIGDTITFAAPGESRQYAMAQKSGLPARYTITGVALDSQDISNPAGYSEGTFRNDDTVGHTVFVADLPGSTPTVTSASLRVQGTGTFDTFSQAYRDHVGRVIDRIEASAQAESGGWHVTDRTQSQNFSSINSDLKSIQSIGRAFPVVFLAVAVLMSLTTMTRLIEENRGLIGTYLALGYGRTAMLLRYLAFSCAACLVGGVLGELVGFVGIPLFLLRVIEGLYVIPHTVLTYDLVYGLGGMALFLLAVGGAAVVAYVREARRMPAELMRPKSPKAGARVLLERIGWVWRRLSFLNKVTARNIFRFKGRLFMTIGGVAGCTALILCGLAINDTVATLGRKQYGDVNRYDAMVVAQDADADSVFERLQSDTKVTDVLRIRAGNAQLSTGSDGGGSGSEAIRLLVVPDGQDLGRMVDMREAGSGLAQSLGIESPASSRARLSLHDDGVLVAQSAATSLGLKAGSRVTLGDGSSTSHEITVDGVFRNLIGSDVYISQSLYESLAGADRQPFIANATLVKLSGSEDERIAFAEHVGTQPGVVSSLSSAKLAKNFSFDLMSAVVALIVALAGGLALVVLFTLANTNVSERRREMATLKVLGFTDREVHQYVNKETIILTAIGTLLGLPLGRFVGGLLTVALNMPSLHFEVEVRWTSYLIAAAVTMAFAFMVQWFTNPVLDRIDPVSSLKSVE